MKPVSYDCNVHVNVCVNEKPEPKSCCSRVGGPEFYEKLKTKVKDAGLTTEIWVTRTRCLGFCNDIGTTVAIHRKGKTPLWFNEVTADDFNSVWEKINS